MKQYPSIRAFFAGPKSENESWMRAEIQHILDEWFRSRKRRFPDDPEAISVAERTSVPFLKRREELSLALNELLERIDGETPKFTPRYIGHMVSETSLPAIFGHFAALLHNPNNTSREVSRVTSQFEDEAIAMLAEMIGYDPACAEGHFTSGGTIANFEGIWRARFRLDHWLSLALYLAEEKGQAFDVIKAAHMGWEKYEALLEDFDVDESDTRPYSLVGGNPFEAAARINQYMDKPYLGPVVLVPGNKHFSWVKGTSVFGLGENAFWPVPLAADGKMECGAMLSLIRTALKMNRPVLMAVSVAGTTETGEIDRVDEVVTVLESLKQQEGLHIWHHVDAAYGGFFCSMLGGDAENDFSVECKASLQAIASANSVTLDPHKLGYVPYSCGAFLSRDEENYRMSSFRAPYIEREYDKPEKWAQTLEGSRSAAGVTATWLSGRSPGFGPDGMGRIVAGTIDATRRVAAEFERSIPDIRILRPMDTNILCFTVSLPGEPLAKANKRALYVFDRFRNSTSFSISKTTLMEANHGAQIKAHMALSGGQVDCVEMVLLRCVFMNPFWSKESVSNHLLPELVAELNGYITDYNC